MRRLLTGHAVSFNRRHKRHGHLFQNRYKSILCQEDPYRLELVRYIRLNPLRAKRVADIGALEKYPFCGHRVFMGKQARQWQDIATVLACFGKTVGSARRSFRSFVSKGVDEGRRWNPIGGGLIRSAGGCADVNALKKANVHVKSDERILGDGAFVETILAESREHYERQYALKAKGIDWAMWLPAWPRCVAWTSSRFGSPGNPDPRWRRGACCVFGHSGSSENA